MKIGYILHPYEESHASGMGYSMLEVCKQLSVRIKEDTFIVYSSKPIDKNTIPGTYESRRMPRGFVRQFFFFLRAPVDLDILLFTAPLLPLWVPRRVKTIVLCKELGSQKIRPTRLFDRIFSFVRDYILMPVTLRRANLIVTSSEATRADVLHFYLVPEERVHVVSEGHQEWRQFPATPERAFESMKPFFFFAGKVKPRKNVHGIVEAFVAFKKRTGSTLQLAIAGDYGGAYHTSMVRKLEEAGLAEQVHFLGYVTGAEMRWLYGHACAFIFPSLNEGFGMPIIEAMSFDVPTLTSENSPMAEIADGAALLIDPRDNDALARGMERIATDEPLRQSLIEKGRERAKLYSWDKTGEGYTALIARLG